MLAFVFEPCFACKSIFISVFRSAFSLKNGDPLLFSFLWDGLAFRLSPPPGLDFLPLESVRPRDGVRGLILKPCFSAMIARALRVLLLAVLRPWEECRLFCRPLLPPLFLRLPLPLNVLS